MTLDHAAAGDLLERMAARETFDGDAWVALFTEDAEYHADPFEPRCRPNAIRHTCWTREPRGRRVHRRAPLGHRPTVLAAWHAATSGVRTGPGSGSPAS